LSGDPTQSNRGILVQPGASISTDVSGFDNGGLVALLAPTVINQGAITTSAGQIALVAGNNITLNQPGTASTNATSTAFGVTSDFAAGSVVTNDAGALLVARRGNITLVADQLKQLGLMEATTSITRAGSFNLAANSLTFGPSSITTILPDENGETLQLNSLSSFVAPSIKIFASALDVQGSAGGAAGALIYAPGATLTAVSNSIFSSAYPVTPLGRALLEAGSVIDLSGLNAAASLSDYLYTFKVTANDVADSPLARNLIGQSVTINLALSGTRSDGLTWVGSPLFSSSGAGYYGNIPQTIDQLLT
jgi:hypothetical protein